MKRILSIFLLLSILFIVFVININAISPSTISGIISGETYYIKNVASQKYLAVDGDGNTNGDNVFSYQINYLSSQKWIVTQNTDGTFTITSVRSNDNKVLTINSNTSNAELYDNTYALNQKFTITRILSGDTKGCYYISIGNDYLYDNALYNSNVLLSNMNYVENISWSFQRVDTGNASLCGFYYPSIIFLDMVISYYNTTTNNSYYYSTFENLGYNSRTPINSTIINEIPYLSNGNIWIYNGHGTIDQNGNPLPAITFVDSNGSSTGSLSAQMIDNNNSNNIFGNQQIVIYLGCTTAVTKYENGNYYNLVNSTYLHGAKCVIGTTQTITSTDMNSWMAKFIEKASVYGTTLKTAVDYANAQTNSIIGLLYIAGDENQQLRGSD